VIQLRPYQQESVDRVRHSFREGKSRPLLVLPTGGGKTICFSHITAGASAKGKRVTILVHRQELLDQCHRSLEAIGVDHGLIASGKTPDPSKGVQVASVQTLVRRLDRTVKPDLIILDEAHHATAGSWLKVLNHWPDAKVLGVTATPARLDGKGLGTVFDDLLVGPEVSELIASGFLCPPVYFAPTTVDLTGVKTTAGDFNRQQASERVDKPKITGDAVEHYRRICDGVPAVAFCTSVKHAENVAAAFRDCGYRSAVIDGTLSDFDRADRVKALADGRLQVLASCDIISEGFDLPLCTAAILLRPTQSLSLHLQQVGRVLRTAPNKPRAVILDHVGNCLRHGLAEEPRDWTLDGVTRRKGKAKDNGPRYAQCPKCYAVHLPAPACPVCNTAREIKERTPEQVTGVLEELKVDHARLDAIRNSKRQQGKAQSLGELIALGKARGMKNAVGWAHYVYSSRLRKRGVA
jgi:superfamily II DNA or RNA helicase